MSDAARGGPVLSSVTSASSHPVHFGHGTDTTVPEPLRKPWPDEEVGMRVSGSEFLDARIGEVVAVVMADEDGVENREISMLAGRR